MSADNLPRINELRIEKNYQNIIPAEKPHFSQEQAYSLGIQKLSDRCPYAVNFSKNGLNKNHPGIFFPHFLRKSEQ